jgi:hypothetical protein
MKIFAKTNLITSLMLIAILSYSSSDSKIELAQHYKSQPPSVWEKATNICKYGLKWGWAGGSALTLNPDSTFAMSTCGNYCNGKWYVQTDSLFLIYEKMRYKIDSFNHIPAWKAKLKVDGIPVGYHIKGKYLERMAFHASDKTWTLIKFMKNLN